MRAVRFLAALSLTAGMVTAVACQEPTQVTVEVRLATAKCSEIHGTAINVGVQPADTEEKVKSKFPNAQTTDCDDRTSRIGTLVITPSDAERASIIVVTSYGTQRDPTECQPPLYTDCIVARRQFTFTKHRRLALPITIDPTCVNVPCDAFSTCRKGFCFKSDAVPCETGEACLEPGETASGGTDVDAAVDVDGSSPDAATDGPGSDDSGGDGGTSDADAANDTGSDGSPDSESDAGSVFCDQNGRIVCPPPASACVVAGPNACCANSMLAVSCVDTTASAGGCPSTHANGRFCCSDLDCGPSEKCNPGDPATPRQCCTVVMMNDIEGGAFKGPAPMCLP
jgi:hypothetical protein